MYFLNGSHGVLNEASQQILTTWIRKRGRKISLPLLYSRFIYEKYPFCTTTVIYYLCEKSYILIRKNIYNLNMTDSCVTLHLITGSTIFTVLLTTIGRNSGRIGSSRQPAKVLPGTTYQKISSNYSEACRSFKYKYPLSSCFFQYIFK